MDLSHVCRTDHWAGLLRSSAKVTLYLHALPSRIATPVPTSRADSRSRQDVGDGFDVWECEVCSYRNPPGLSPSASMICGLCGVPRSAVPTMPGMTSSSVQLKPRSVAELNHLSSSLPSSSHHLPLPTQSDPPSQIPCPACTFLNHPSLPSCEICGTALPRPLHPTARSVPRSRPASDDEDDDDETEEGLRMIKLSFRKGGDKAFYAVLRRSLLDKTWEVSAPPDRWQRVTVIRVVTPSQRLTPAHSRAQNCVGHRHRARLRRGPVPPPPTH